MIQEEKASYAGGGYEERPLWRSLFTTITDTQVDRCKIVANARQEESAPAGTTVVCMYDAVHVLITYISINTVSAIQFPPSLRGE